MAGCIHANTWIAIGYFFFAVFINSLAQLWGESQPDLPADCKLYDTGFMLVPHIHVSWISQATIQTLSDTWVVVSVLTAFIMFGFLTRHPQLTIRRFILLWATAFLIRGTIVGDTRYPRLNYNSNEKFLPKNPVWGAILIMVGARTSITDAMYSGHTATWIITAYVALRYVRCRILKVFYLIFNIFGIVSLLAVREHYSADIVVAVWMSSFIFLVYHLFLDPLFIRKWKPAIVVALSEGALLAQPRYALPLTIRDAEGHEFTTSGHEGSFIWPGREATPVTIRVYRWIKWLDSGTLRLSSRESSSQKNSRSVKSPPPTTDSYLTTRPYSVSVRNLIES